MFQGTCFEYTDNEYIYKMCPFDMCSQRGKHGGSETRLGSWGEWTGGESNRSVSSLFLLNIIHRFGLKHDFAVLIQYI